MLTTEPKSSVTEHMVQHSWHLTRQSNEAIPEHGGMNLYPECSWSFSATLLEASPVAS